MKKTDNKKRGFSLVEVLVSLAILSMFIVAGSTFEKDVFSLNTNLQSGLNAQLEGRHVVKIMVSELRRTSTSVTGSYPIELASSTAITFYSDTNNDGVIDRIRYFLSGTVIKKGVTKPTGTPYVYNTANETLTTLVNNVVSSSTLPVFQYFTSSYAGTSSPMTYPVDIPSVRLVRINVIIDNDPNRSPVPIIVTSSVSMRNLKDNL